MLKQQQNNDQKRRIGITVTFFPSRIKVVNIENVNHINIEIPITAIYMFINFDFKLFPNHSGEKGIIKIKVKDCYKLYEENQPYNPLDLGNRLSIQLGFTDKVNLKVSKNPGTVSVEPKVLILNYLRIIPKISLFTKSAFTLSELILEKQTRPFYIRRSHYGLY